MPSLHDLPFAALERTLAVAGLHASHARPLWRALYRDTVTDLRAADASRFLLPLRRWLDQHVFCGGDAYGLDVPHAADEIPSGDGLTRKFLLRLADGQTVETVLMAYAAVTPPA